MTLIQRVLSNRSCGITKPWPSRPYHLPAHSALFVGLGTSREALYDEHNVYEHDMMCIVYGALLIMIKKKPVDPTGGKSCC